MEMILGVGVSLLVQFMKRKYGTEGGKVVVACVALSVVSAIAYAGLVELGYLETVKEVLTTAGAFYAFVIRQVENLPEVNKPFLQR